MDFALKHVSDDETYFLEVTKNVKFEDCPKYWVMARKLNVTVKKHTSGSSHDLVLFLTSGAGTLVLTDGIMTAEVYVDILWTNFRRSAEN